MKHTPQFCPMFNNDVKNKFKEIIGKRDEVAKKLGVKVLSAYSPTVEHRIFFIVDAPSQQAVESYFWETGYLFWNAVETLAQVQLLEDVIKRIVG
jgi:hypothetical protein